MGEYKPLYITIAILFIFGIITPFLISDFVDVQEDIPDTPILLNLYNFVNADNTIQTIQGLTYDGTTNNRGEEYGYIVFDVEKNKDFIRPTFKTPRLTFFTNNMELELFENGQSFHVQTLRRLASGLNPFQEAVTGEPEDTATTMEIRIYRTQDRLINVFLDERDFSDAVQSDSLEVTEIEENSDTFFNWFPDLSIFNPFTYFPEGVKNYFLTMIIGLSILPTALQIPLVTLVFVGFIYTIIKLLPTT